MRATKVTLRRTQDGSKVLAEAELVLDDVFVVRRIRMLRHKGGYLIAMPCRDVYDRCPRCGSANGVGVRFCGSCGLNMPEDRVELDDKGRPRLTEDVAYPINVGTAKMLDAAVTSAYKRSQEDGSEGWVSYTVLEDGTLLERPPAPTKACR